MKPPSPAVPGLGLWLQMRTGCGPLPAFLWVRGGTLLIYLHAPPRAGSDFLPAVLPSLVWRGMGGSLAVLIKVYNHELCCVLTADLC